MKILFIGGVFDKNEHQALLNQKGAYFDPASDNFQWNLIKGFEENGEDVTLLNAPFIGYYPKQSKTLFYKGRKWSHNKTSQDVDISFINLMFFKQLMRLCGCKKQVRRWIKANPEEQLKIISYCPFIPYIKAMSYAKKISSNVTTAIVITDYIKEPSQQENRNLIYKLTSFFNGSAIEFMQDIDGFVLLTEQMKDLVQSGNRPVAIVEGIVNPDEISKMTLPKKSNGKIRITYTGTLHKKYGIETLLLAFSMLKGEEYELCICGYGDFEQRLMEAALVDKRIKFYGQIPRDEALKLQHDSDVLVNPRQNNGEYTKYSFPSKTMEYLLSGVLVVCYKLSGIPDEYDEFLNYAIDNSPEALCKILKDISSLSKEERGLRGNLGKEYVINNKNRRKQCEKISELLFLNER